MPFITKANLHQSHHEREELVSYICGQPLSFRHGSMQVHSHQSLERLLVFLCAIGSQRALRKLVMQYCRRECLLFFFALYLFVSMEQRKRTNYIKNNEKTKSFIDSIIWSNWKSSWGHTITTRRRSGQELHRHWVLELNLFLDQRHISLLVHIYMVFNESTLFC